VEQSVSDFDQLNKQARMFLICCPIDPSSDSDSLIAVKVMHDLLLREGIPIEPLEDLLARGRNGLVTCNCGIYLHYVWCKHTYAIAIQRGIIREPYFPKYRNPRNKNCLQTKKKVSVMRPFVGTGGRSIALRKDSSSDDEADSDDDSAVRDDEVWSLSEESDLEDELDYYTDEDVESHT